MAPHNPRPQLTLEQASKLVHDLYGLEASSIKPLVGYDDLNFFFAAASCSNPNIVGSTSTHGYVLKVTNSEDSKIVEPYRAHGRIMRHLAEEGMRYVLQSKVKKK